MITQDEHTARHSPAGACVFPAGSDGVGGLVQDGAALAGVSALLATSDFFRHEHRLIYDAIATLAAAAQAIDVVTVFSRLHEAGTAEACGGLAAAHPKEQAA